MIMRHRFFLFVALMCTLAPFAWAEGIPVMRFVPVAGEESEVALNTVLDTTSLTGKHMESGKYFLLNVITNDLSNW